jgi:uncharacterized protein (DUF58 family)
MTPGIKALLKPEVINTVNGLELIARVLAEGFMSGSNKSQSVGVGQEFSQYRNYEPGDDLRQLDWKMYARSERYFIKQADIETNITVKFMLDASASMRYEEEVVNKFDFSKVLTAALAFLARKQGDTFGLYIVNEANLVSIQPRFEQQQFMRFLHELVEAKPASRWISSSHAESLFDHHGKEMIIFFTDLYDEAEDLQQFISRLKTPRNEVLVFHVMGRRELLLDYEGSLTFRDLESNNMIKVDTPTQRKAYQEKIQLWINQWRDRLLEKNISYHLMTMNDPPEDVLRNFLKARKNLL